MDSSGDVVRTGRIPDFTLLTSILVFPFLPPSALLSGVLFSFTDLKPEYHYTRDSSTEFFNIEIKAQELKHFADISWKTAYQPIKWAIASALAAGLEGSTPNLCSDLVLCVSLTWFAFPPPHTLFPCKVFLSLGAAQPFSVWLAFHIMVTSQRALYCSHYQGIGSLLPGLLVLFFVLFCS